MSTSVLKALPGKLDIKYSLYTSMQYDMGLEARKPVLGSGEDKTKSDQLQRLARILKFAFHIFSYCTF